MVEEDIVIGRLFVQSTFYSGSKSADHTSSSGGLIAKLYIAWWIGGLVIHGINMGGQTVGGGESTYCFMIIHITKCTNRRNKG